MTISRYGFDINQPGASSYPRISIRQPTAYRSGLVVDVITNETHKEYSPDGSNIGYIKFRAIPYDQNEADNNLNWIPPIESNIQEYPLVDEIVMIMLVAGKPYYSRRINTTNKITDGYLLEISTQYAPTPASGEPASENSQLAAQGVRTGDLNKPKPIGASFVSNLYTLPVRSFEGDVIVQGRFGNIIRMGSSQFTNPNVTVPDANILITAGQWDSPVELSTRTKTSYSLTYENINRDKNSIWMVVNEKVPFLASTTNTNSSQKAHLRSCATPTAEYSGSQMFLSSDRIILNSKKSEISLFSSTQINLSSLNDITVDSETSVRMTANNMISISSPKIFIGSEDATEPMVLGNKLVQFLNEFIKVFSSVPAAVITTSGPAPFNPALLSQLTTLQSKLSAADFISDDNFTTKTNTITVKNTAQSQLIQKQTLDATRAEKPFTLRKSITSRG
jgi:hypothetical protein